MKFSLCPETCFKGTCIFKFKGAIYSVLLCIYMYMNMYMYACNLCE